MSISLATAYVPVGNVQDEAEDAKQFVNVCKTFTSVAVKFADVWFELRLLNDSDPGVNV
jgi:aspartate ammonia-lyase